MGLAISVLVYAQLSAGICLNSLRLMFEAGKRETLPASLLQYSQILNPKVRRISGRRRNARPVPKFRFAEPVNGIPVKLAKTVDRIKFRRCPHLTESPPSTGRDGDCIGRSECDLLPGIGGASGRAARGRRYQER